MNLHGLPNHAVPIPGGEPHSDVMKRCDEFFEVNYYFIVSMSESSFSILSPILSGNMPTGGRYNGTTKYSRGISRVMDFVLSG